jgi:PAS domain S-box-containing protein
MRASFEKSLREKVDSSDEYRIVLPDGTVKHVHTIRHPVLNGAGDIVKLVGTSIDITGRKRAEEALSESERKYRELVEHANSIILRWTHDGRITFLNEFGLKFFGYSAEEIIGRQVVGTIVPPTETGGRDLRQLMLQVCAAPRAFEQNINENMRRNGERVTIAWTNKIVWGAQGEVAEILSVGTDITERRRAEEALRQSEAYLAESQRLTHTGSWAFDLASNKYIYASEECFRIFELDAQDRFPNREVISRQIHPEDWDRVNESFEKSLRERVDTSTEFRIVLPSGTVKHIQAIRHPVMNDAGDIVKLVGTAIDMTEHKRAEEERERLDQLEADLARINRVSMMGELAASIAHEVNQPLSGVVVNGNACLRWLAGDSPNLDEAREAVRRIVRDGKRAGDVIARIRALATKTATAKERLDMNEAIREVVALAGDELRKNRVAVRTEFAPDLLPVLGDRVQLQQVVLNLVMNGIEAMSSVEERPRELTIRTQNDDADLVRVTVQDSGMGLDPQSMERIFDAFYTTKRGGMGMGLSISRSIIQNHGGKLWAVANDGPGMSVQFTIPKYH